MNNLYMYVNELPCPYDPKKGLLLWGSIGTGKSTIIRILGEVFRHMGDGYKTISCSTLATHYASNGRTALESSTYNEGASGLNPVNRAFDELGREPIPSRYFGVELNVMQYVFQCRYELRNSVKTFATTNMNPDSLSQLYGDYIKDRLSEMFNIVQMSGKSLRE